jgi:5-methyltetrahydrofolate--homocysteine methyltransferase
VLDAIPLDETLALLDTRALFRGRWAYRQGRMPAADYEALVDREVRPALDRLSAEALREGWTSRAVYGYFPVRADHHGLTVLHDDGSERTRFDLPRQPAPPHLALQDWFRDERGATPDVLPLFVVTVNPGLLERIRCAHQADAYRDYLHAFGFSIELVEATAEWVHALVRRELGVGAAQGQRFSFGYPSAPDLSLQGPLFALLDAGRLGVTLTESFQMVPEQSVSAMVVPHAGTRLFDLG